MLKKVDMMLPGAAAEEEKIPAILQIHSSALKQAGIPLVACCIAAAGHANVPITVHFDHGNSKQGLLDALELGFDSVMADGSHLSFNKNIAYTKYISNLAHSKNMLVEAELGRLSGTEDDLTVKECEGKLIDITQVVTRNLQDIMQTTTAMGSLMAGWDSLNLDPKTVILERNKSFTKEKIENFWETHKPSQQHHTTDNGEVAKPQISFDFVFQEIKCPINLEKTHKASDWWTRSNSAFLNEPPHEEIQKSAGSNYAAQFHVAAQHTTTKVN